jgi:hypothetical protein
MVHATDTSDEWIWHLLAAKEVLNDSQASLRRPEVVTIALWAQHYDALSSFSLLHWRRHAGSPENAYVKLVGDKVVQFRSAGNCFRISMWDQMPPANRIVGLLCDGFLYHFPNFKPANHSSEADRRAFMIAKQAQLLEVDTPDIEWDTTPISPETAAASLADMEIWRLSALIYLGRLADSAGPEHLQQWTEVAFTILRRLKTYLQPFPLMILGMEADSDERRVIILELMQRTMEGNVGDRLDVVRQMIQSAWAQNDLMSLRRLNYMDQLNVVISSSATMPAFL